MRAQCQAPLLTLPFLVNFLGVLSRTADDVGFYHLVSKADDLCVGVNGPAPSIAGWIGLTGDSDVKPKRSFFWYVRCVLFFFSRVFEL